jgi:hypothetical protein
MFDLFPVIYTLTMSLWPDQSVQNLYRNKIHECAMFSNILDNYINFRD